MIYDVDLDDGRTVTLEADNPPSEQDIYAALQSYQPPAPRPQLQPGDLAGLEARQIPDLTATTRGGPPAKLASFAETIQEPLALAPEMVVHEGITLPGLSETIKKAGEQYIGGLGIRGVSTPTPPEQFTPAQKLASGAIQGVDELVEGVANFLSSSQGIAETGAAASPIAPAVYLKWANDMVRGGMLNAGEAYDAYKRGDWETFAKQVTGGLGMLLGAGAVTKHGISKIAEPIQAFTGGTPRLEEANAKALAATIPPEISPITKAGETYASTIPETTSVPQLEVRPRVGEETPLRQQGEVTGAQQPVSGSPKAEVVPAEQPPKIEPTPIDRAQRFQDLKQAEAEGRLDEEGAAELADLIAADEAAKAEQKRIAAEFKASQETTAPAPPSETAVVTTSTPEHLARTTERGLESKIRVSKDRETGEWNVVEDFYESGTNKKVDAEFLESFGTEEEALRHAATLKKSETVEALSEPITLSAEDKADVRMDEPGITRKTTPNVIVIQLRDLESRPIREVEIKPTGNPMTDAQNVVRRIRQEAADDNRISLRESGGNSTDQNGMGILHFTDSPNGPAFASVRDLVEARKKTKFTLPESESEARQLAKKQFAEMKAQEGIKMAPEGVPSPAAKINLSNASIALAKAGLSYVIGQPREQFAKSPKRKIMERYWKALDEYEASKKRSSPIPSQPPLSEGPGAASPGDVPKQAQIEQLASAFKNINSQKAPLSERIKQAFDFGKQRDLSRDLIGRTLSALKTSGDYLVDTWKGVNEVDPILKVKGQLSSELELRGWRMRQAMKDMKRAVPDIKTREAISKWVDAGGDPEVLRNAAETVPANRRSAYERALQLTPREKIFAEHIKSYFESRLQEAKDAGVLENGIEDYIHRIYPRETPWRKGVLNAIQNGVLNTRRPGLAMKRVFEFDAEAEKAGLKPVGDFIPRVLDYEASLSKVIASREAVKRFTEIKMPDGRPMLDTAGIGMPIEGAEGVREATLIKPSFKPGEHQIGTDGKPTLNYRKDYQARDYGALKKWKWATKDENGNPIFVQGDVLIHPDAVHRIDALLEPSKIRKYAAARAALAVGSTFKQTMLDFSGFHQVQIAIHGLEHKVNPFNLVKEIDAENPNVRGLLRGGVTLGGEHVTGMAQEGLVGRSLSRQIPGLGPLMQTYHSWLFQDFIPRVKMTMALHALERNRSRFAKDLASGKMTEDALFYQTAKEANAAFGELNYIMLERSKTAQDMARMILLAPDFLEARGRFVGQSLTKPGGEQRMALLLGALALYTTARVMNKAISGEYHNEPENLFSVVHNGKAYSIRTVQGDVLHAIEEPVKFWLHRLNPTMTRPLFELLSGRDEFGRKRNFWQVMGDTVSNAIPISMRHGREQSIWTSLLNAFGGSVRRNSEVRRIYDAAQEWKKANNIRTEPGEFIYDPSQDIYRPLKLAILDGDTGTAMLEYRKLIDSKVVTPKQASEHFSTYARSPFSGSRANETKFYNSLSEDEKKSYEGAKQEKQRILQGFIKAGGMSPKPVQLKPITRQK